MIYLFIFDSINKNVQNENYHIDSNKNQILPKINLIRSGRPNQPMIINKVQVESTLNHYKHHDLVMSNCFNFAQSCNQRLLEARQNTDE